MITVRSGENLFAPPEKKSISIFEQNWCLMKRQVLLHQSPDLLSDKFIKWSGDPTEAIYISNLHLKIILILSLIYHEYN